MWDFKSALPTADGKIKDFAAAPQGLRCVPSGGARKRSAVTLPSSDEEGADAVGGRRDNAHSALCRLTGSSACGAKERTVVTLPSSDDTHRSPGSAGIRQRRAGNRRFRAGWSRLRYIAKARLLKEGADAVGGRRDNAPFALPRTPYPRKNPAPRSWNSASETPSSSSRCAFGSSAGTPNSSCIL